MEPVDHDPKYRAGPFDSATPVRRLLHSMQSQNWQTGYRLCDWRHKNLRQPIPSKRTPAPAAHREKGLSSCWPPRCISMRLSARYRSRILPDAEWCEKTSATRPSVHCKLEYRPEAWVAFRLARCPQSKGLYR